MPAPYQFHDVFIQIFDLNAIPEFLRASLPAIKAQPFGFLGLKGEYEKRQVSDASSNSNNFVISRFPKNKLNESELWQRYSDVYPSTKVPYWDRQIPFFLRLRKHNLALNLAAAQYTVDSYVTINALGWSTHVEIRIQADLSPDALAAILANLRSKTFQAYTLNNQAMTLKDIFSYYRGMVLHDGFAHNLSSNQPDNFWHIAHVDIINATGTDTRLPRLKAIDLNAFLNVVFPNHAQVIYQVDGQDRIPRVQNMLFTNVDGDYHNFSVTDFNAGTFNFLQSDALVRGNETRLMCYAHNTAECMWLCYLWFLYHRLYDKTHTNPRIDSLIGTGQDALLNLKKTFNNRTCQGMFFNHKDMPAE